MSKRIVVHFLTTITCLALMLLALAGCSAEAEEPTVPANTETGSNATPTSATLTDSEKLKGLALGETAVWRDYEVTIKEIERGNAELTVHLEITSHNLPQTLSVENLMSFGTPALSSSFENEVIEVASGETATGTLIFNDQYNSQRLFWNDGATEGWWLLDLPPVRNEQESPDAVENEEATRDKPAENTPSANTAQSGEQKQAIAALEAEIPSLFANNTYYTYQTVDSAAAKVKPLEAGGYEYTNTVNILDGDGKQRAIEVLLICEPNGNCISMTLEGVKVF